MTELGEGLVYAVDTTWAKLPPGWFLGDVGGVAVDRDDRVYVFSRSEHPVTVFDRDGRFLRSWGEGLFTRPHGISIGDDGCVYCTDDGDHTVRRCSPEGRLLLEIGVPGRSAAPMSGAPFNRCTHAALSREGNIYVSDGYGNAHVHVFDPAGRHLFSWGGPGMGSGQFNVPHNICCDDDGRVYVADRESHRIQVFNGDGRYETELRGVHRPCAMCLRRQGSARHLYVGEVPPSLPVNRATPNLGPRITVMTCRGDILARIGDPGPGESDRQFVAPHGIAVDSRGDVYVGEVANAAWGEIFPDRPRPDRLCTLRKLTALTRQEADSPTSAGWSKQDAGEGVR